MKIDHLAIWTFQLEKLKAFYEQYFQATSGEKYVNPKKKFESYFLSFDTGCRLEIMQMPGVEQVERNSLSHTTGITHFAVSVGTKERVDALTESLRSEGYQIAGEPRTTGDGYYESVVLDPDGNAIEITI